MPTLLGLFESRERGLQAQEHLQEAGFAVRAVDSATRASAIADDTTRGEPAGAGTGAALGALTGGLVGAAPGAALGKLLGRWLSTHEAQAYQETVAAGGVALVVDASEVAPAAQAEVLLRESGAERVHTGEVPPG